MGLGSKKLEDEGGGGAPHAPPARKPWGQGWGGWRGLTAGSYNPPNPLAAKVVSEGDAYMRTDAKIKFLYYPLDCFT